MQRNEVNLQYIINNDTPLQLTIISMSTFVQCNILNYVLDGVSENILGRHSTNLQDFVSSPGPSGSKWIIFLVPPSKSMHGKRRFLCATNSVKDTIFRSHATFKLGLTKLCFITVFFWVLLAILVHGGFPIREWTLLYQASLEWPWTMYHPVNSVQCGLTGQPN